MVTGSVSEAVKPVSSIASRFEFDPARSADTQADNGLVTGVHDALDHRLAPIRHVVGEPTRMSQTSAAGFRDRRRATAA